MKKNCIIAACLVWLFITSTALFAEGIDLKPDTWTATDALGRTLPGYTECGPPRVGKFVGIFYFLWSGAHGTGGPYDITKILADDPANPKWGPETSFHHWGESELGYYVSDDAYVIRKHARMLANAGVDTLIFDATNNVTYLPTVKKLCRIYSELRAAGEKTPQFCFITRSESAVNSLFDKFYSKNLYPDLWFRWQGKPLILALATEYRPEVRDFFTFRESWAWTGGDTWFGDGHDKWPWLDFYPQIPGWHIKGVPEEVSVSVAQHPTTNIGRSYHDGIEPEPADQRPAEGLWFAEQWKGALKIDPEFIYITGWNEWVAQKFVSRGTDTLAGRVLPVGETYFVDDYTEEYSRDIEPMKGGHTDNYYYQMIAGIRRFKGVRPDELASKPKSIRIDGKFDDWNDVRPEYRDTAGDIERRYSRGWGKAGIYINRTGRNDLVSLKVARDADNVYFYAETKSVLSDFKKPNWMLLFIDADNDFKTGWNGYDYLVNRSVIDGRKTALCQWTDAGWKRSAVIPYRALSNKLEISIPRKALGMTGKPVSFDFHWADNIQKQDDIIEFAVSGDSAPDRRFNYQYHE